MAQSQGMRNAYYPHHVYRLHKAIYGLKQALRAWYQALHTFLLGLVFVTFPANSYFFVYSRGNVLIYFLVYVDDLIITGSNPPLLTILSGNLTPNSPQRILGCYLSSMESRLWPLRMVFYYLSKSMFLIF